MGRNEPSTVEDSGEVALSNWVFTTRSIVKRGQGLALRLLDDRKRKDHMLMKCLCFPKSWQSLQPLTPLGNVQLGKEVAATHHQGGHHQSVGPAKKKRSCQVTMTTAGTRYEEQRWTTYTRFSQNFH